MLPRIERRGLVQHLLVATTLLAITLTGGRQEIRLHEKTALDRSPQRQQGLRGAPLLALRASILAKARSMRLHHYFVPAILLAIVGTIRAEESRPDDGNIIRVAVDAAKPARRSIRSSTASSSSTWAVVFMVAFGPKCSKIANSIIRSPMSTNRIGEQTDTKFPVVGASPWQVIGPAGSVTMVKEDAFVGEHSPRIAAGSGIRQNDLGVIEGKEYVGYVWLRAAERQIAKFGSIACVGRRRREARCQLDARQNRRLRRTLASGSGLCERQNTARLVIEVTGGPASSALSR